MVTLSRALLSSEEKSRRATQRGSTAIRSRYMFASSVRERSFTVKDP
jgi:hypothetical protein